MVYLEFYAKVFELLVIELGAIICDEHSRNVESTYNTHFYAKDMASFIVIIIRTSNSIHLEK